MEPAHEAYSRRAADYIDAVGRIEHAAQADRDYLLTWARSIDGRVIDVGCGPGQWTDYLRAAGIDIEGVDPSEVFITEAKRSYPRARYRLGRAEELGVTDESVGGILAWFSLIHTDPTTFQEPLQEFARCLRAGGSLALGYFEGEAREPFDHAITTAYYWSVEALSSELDAAGFEISDRAIRQDSGVRRQGVIVATRRMPGVG